MRISARLALVPLAILAGACASGNAAPGSPASDRILVQGADGNPIHQVVDPGSRVGFAAPVARVWPKVQAVYADLGLPVNSSDQAAGRYGAVNVLLPRRLNDVGIGTYFSCGSNITGPVVNQGRIRADVITTLTARPDSGTDALIVVAGTLRKTDGSSSDPIVCQSTGHLEEVIRQSIERKLAEPYVAPAR